MIEINTKLFILAAGFGSRMVPVTLTTPKPLVKVNGTPFIETIINSFKANGVLEKNIYVIRGYKKETFDVLLDKYPKINFVDNDNYDKGNNILSIEKVLNLLDNECFICEADLYINNIHIVPTNRQTCYLARPVAKTDDWCFDLSKDNKLYNYRKGGDNCYIACGLSYWTKEDALKLRDDVINALKENKNRDIFWEFVPFVLYPDHYNVRPNYFNEKDICEIDSFEELCQIDNSYRK